MLNLENLKRSIFEVTGVIPAFTIEVNDNLLCKAVLVEPQFSVSDLEALHTLYGGDFGPVNLNGKKGLRLDLRYEPEFTRNLR